MKKIALWSPTPDQIESANMSKFINFINLKYSIKLKNYNDLYQWSITYIANFWDAIWNFMDVIYSKEAKNTLTQLRNSNPKDIRSYRWFCGAKLNFAENLLRFNDEETALIYCKENAKPKYISYKELYLKTAQLAHSFKKSGVSKQDRVAALISNNPEAVTGMLATSSIGAIWSSTSPDFGLQGVLDRFSQIEPKILITVDGYYYNGKKYDIMNTVKEISLQIPEIEQIVVINQIGEKLPDDPKFISWDNYIKNDADEIEFEQLDFDHPLYIMYSSGTTGVPKCIVHGQGGTLLQHMKELVLHTNLTDLDVISYYTTCGWMMWNWLITSLSVGASVVLIDGSPNYPNINRLWDLIDELGITKFGTSPKFLATCRKDNIVPADTHSLSSLDTILSTGSPLSEDDFKWVYKNVKGNLQLSSISGGTDIISCFMLGNPIVPVYSEEIQCLGLGMKVEAWDENNKAVIEQKGELVCTAPFPSMPIYFWNDDDDEKYHQAYFDFYPGIWKHGDYIRITERNGVIMYGRSDATLNPGGVRIGTSEIYRVVEAMDEVRDSVVVGLSRNNDIEIILFVVLDKDLQLSDILINKIKNNIKTELTPRHLPKQVFQIQQVPITISGKKVELAILKTLNGEEVKNKTALANPESLEQFKNIVIK
ncbi:MAG TPA: acetoacetate--CoA ligase [Candidatus Kapabacteria bacterium]|nr:acetoacetate--CoA ligase [Candidatus Kapabacteria bacterium]